MRPRKVVALVIGAPKAVFDLVVGPQRWTFRVLAHAGLMTDEHPPFRLDGGGAEPPSVAAEVPPSPDRDPQLSSACPQTSRHRLPPIGGGRCWTPPALVQRRPARYLA
jgi:hypothetical protein